MTTYFTVKLSKANTDIDATPPNFIEHDNRIQLFAYLLLKVKNLSDSLEFGECLR